MNKKSMIGIILSCCLIFITLYSCGSGGGGAGTNNAGATLTSISVTPANPSIANGASQQYSATGTYSDNSTQVITGSVTWSSSDTSKATVSSVGLATGVAAGTSVITATSGSLFGTSMLTVTAQTATLVSIVITPANPSISTVATQQFTATGAYSDSTAQDITGSVTWSSSNTSKAAISSAGMATGIAAGTSIISATVGSIFGTTTLTVTVPVKTLTSITVSPSNSSIIYGVTQQFTVTGTYTDSTSAILTTGIAWTSVNVCNLASLNAYTPTTVYSSTLSDARSQFTYISSLANLGDTVAIGKLQSISTIFLTLSQQYYASSAPYFTDFNTVINALVQTTSLELRDIDAATANACGLASLRAFTSSLKLGTLGGLSPENKLAEARAQFTDISNRAKLGDTEANWKVNSVATEFLNASNYYYGGGAGYVTDFNTVQQALSVIQSLVIPAAPASISSNSGLATGVAVGTSIITATSDGISGSTTLKITVP